MIEMKRILLALILLALPLAAQGEKKEEPPRPAPVQKLFVLKYADPRTVADLLRIFNAPINYNGELHTLAVSAMPETMKAIEDAIARLDTPAAAPKNIDLTFHLVVGTQGEGAPAAALPKELDSVIAQLKSTFPFKSYRLLDTITIRARLGVKAEGSSSAGSSGPAAIITQIRLDSTGIAPDGATIRIDHLRADHRIPVFSSNTQYQYVNIGINTDVDVKDGQKVVIGRMGIDRDQALFLVLMAHSVN
jgi:hypothetical protein